MHPLLHTYTRFYNLFIYKLSAAVCRAWSPGGGLALETKMEIKRLRQQAYLVWLGLGGAEGGFCRPQPQFSQLSNKTTARAVRRVKGANTGPGVLSLVAPAGDPASSDHLVQFLEPAGTNMAFNFYSLSAGRSPWHLCLCSCPDSSMFYGATERLRGQNTSSIQPCLRSLVRSLSPSDSGRESSRNR